METRCLIYNSAFSDRKEMIFDDSVFQDIER